MIELGRKHFEDIVLHAREEAPFEACGVVAGENGRAMRVFSMDNAERSETLYRFDDREQLAVFDEVDQRGWDLLAFYHSHPSTEAYPSPTDRSRAHWKDPVTGDLVPTYPGTRYLIVSLSDPDEPVLRAFRFEDGEAVEEEVKVV